MLDNPSRFYFSGSGGKMKKLIKIGKKEYVLVREDKTELGQSLGAYIELKKKKKSNKS